ncbi:MAG: hypothetical protein WC519_01620 [Parcubacteria group bacterium]
MAAKAIADCNCGRRRIVRVRRFAKMFPDSQVLEAAAQLGYPVVHFKIKKCPTCSDISLKDALMETDAHLRGEEWEKDIKPIADLAQ